MALFDWNHDGKKDWQDNYIEYNIYKRSKGENHSSSGYSPSGGSGSTLGTIIAVIVVFLILGGIVSLFTPKCIVDGCDSEQTEGSSYCYYHENSAVYKYYKTHSNSSVSYDNSVSSTPSTTNSPSYSSGTTKSFSGNSSTKKSSTYDSYDDGYDDIYMDGDYDYDRYDNDSDYADGVDDAMDEFEEDW